MGKKYTSRTANFGKRFKVYRISMRQGIITIFSFLLVACGPVPALTNIPFPTTSLVATTVVPTLPPMPSLTQITQPTRTPTLSPTQIHVPTLTQTAEVPLSPPIGLVFRVANTVWIVREEGPQELITNILPEVRTIQLCSSEEKVLTERETEFGGMSYAVVEPATGKRIEMDPGKDQTFCSAAWWPGRCDILLAVVQPYKEVGRHCNGIPAVLDMANNLALMGSSTDRDGVLAAPSDDGLQVAFTQNSRPWIYHWGESAQALDVPHEIFPLDNIGFIRPTWSPDHQQVAWLVWGEMNGEWTEGIGIIDLTNNRWRFLYPYTVWNGEYPSYLDWNPQQDYICLETRNGDVSVLTSDGVQQYSVGNAVISKWSPDGKWLAYSSYDSGIHRVYIRSAEGKDVHESGTGDPMLWSPDSRKLLVHNSKSFSILEVGVWLLENVDLPGDAEIVDWVGPEKNQK